MTVLFIDGFDHYATADIAKKYSSVTSASITSAAGRRSTNGLRILAGQSVTKSLGGNKGTIVYGGANKLSTLTGGSSICQFIDNATVQVSLTANADGSLTANRASATALGSSAAGVITAGTTYYIEFKATIDSAAGTVDVYVNGASVISLTGQNTRNSANSYATLFKLGPSGSATLDTDDLYLDDATVHGDVRIDSLFPSGAGSNTTWAPSTGSNYTCVDEASVNTTDYVSSATVGNVDTYAFGDLSAVTGSIIAVAVNNTVSKDDAGAKTVANVVKSSTTTSVGADFAPSSGSWLVCQQLWETDPDTSTAWTESGVNAAEFGCKVTS